MENDSAGLWLIRHGEGTHNTGGFYSSRPEHPRYRPAKLTELGRSQALEMADKLAAQGVTASNVAEIWVSPLPRTLETARLAMERLKIPEHQFEVDDRLIEAGVGDREGGIINSYKDKDFWFPDNPERFGGETRTDIRRRMVSACKDIAGNRHNSNPGHVLVFSHGSPLYLLIEALTGQGRRLGTAEHCFVAFQALSGKG